MNDYLSPDPFAEIELAGERQPISQQSLPLAPAIKPVMDERRKRFAAMRQIARDHALLRMDHGLVLYKQGQFMADFEDDCPEQAAFLAHYPTYQQMGYEQLRTHFSWRTKARQGELMPIAPSYVRLYVYELLHNIGVNTPEEGLDALMALHKANIIKDEILERHLFKWLKDYHVYYPIKKPFFEFASEHDIIMHYSSTFGYGAQGADCFAIFSSLSRYNVLNSAFFNEKTKKLICAAFTFVIVRLRLLCHNKQLDFDALIFKSVGEAVWTPFSGAVFYPHLKQEDRKTALSSGESYSVAQSKWKCKTRLVTDSGKRLIGCIMKLTEMALRRLKGYRFRLSISQRELNEAGQYMGLPGADALSVAVNEAVCAYHALATRKVVAVDAKALDKIRHEADIIRDRLLVPEEAPAAVAMPVESKEEANRSDGWEGLIRAFTAQEKAALALILRGGDLMAYASANGIMAEVLVDNINQKAYDNINDTLLDFADTAQVYLEYRSKLQEWVNC